jgi:hypothetical protein
MKKIIFTMAAVLACSQYAFAKNNCSLLENCDKEDPQYRVCTAVDANAEVYKYYTATWWQAPYTKKQALKKCQADSEAPSTCKVAGCVEY